MVREDFKGSSDRLIVVKTKDGRDYCGYVIAPDLLQLEIQPWDREGKDTIPVGIPYDRIARAQWTAG